MNRRDPLIVGEYYHIFNRGVERRQIFHSRFDYERFFETLFFFNTEKPAWLVDDLQKSEYGYHPCPEERLVDIIAYCLNPNHFHLILKENKVGGIPLFMKKISTGYAMYYNKKNSRSGVLFQGRFKSVHIGSNDLLLYVSAYVNCNSQIHGGEDAGIYRWCSFPEYLGKEEKGSALCQKDIILQQFRNIQEYETFCLEKALGMRAKKALQPFHLE